MTKITLRAYPSTARLPVEKQLAMVMARMAADVAPLEKDVLDMIGNRIIDNAAVAMASLNRAPVRSARAQAKAFCTRKGASLYGVFQQERFNVAWAAWANGVAVRELDFHDTFLAADYAHPADCIPALLAVAQGCGLDGAALARGIAVSYEIHVALVKGICLHAHKIDHIAHLGPAIAAGLGAMLGCSPSVTYQAIQQALHCCVTTRQSRKGEISSWKAFAPAYAGKTAIEAMDRALRGEGSPSPVYEGEDSILAWMLNPRTARDRGEDPYACCYEVHLPDPGAPLRAIMETYTKQHAAEYQAQAMIDLAFDLRAKIDDTEAIADILILTSHHTHTVIGTGANDPQKMDKNASRETLDHSLPYIFAVALQDGTWHHEDSYLPERARRPDTVRLWHKICTEEGKGWTQAYHHRDPARKAFGGHVRVTMKDGSVLTAECRVAHAHPAGKKPFARSQYVEKFNALSAPVLSSQSSSAFLEAVQQFESLQAADLGRLVPTAPAKYMQENIARGLF